MWWLDAKIRDVYININSSESLWIVPYCKDFGWYSTSALQLQRRMTFIREIYERRFWLFRPNMPLVSRSGASERRYVKVMSRTRYLGSIPCSSKWLMETCANMGSDSCNALWVAYEICLASAEMLSEWPMWLTRETIRNALWLVLVDKERKLQKLLSE